MGISKIFSSSSLLLSDVHNVRDVSVLRETARRIGNGRLSNIHWRFMGKLCVCMSYSTYIINNVLYFVILTVSNILLLLLLYLKIFIWIISVAKIIFDIFILQDVTEYFLLFKTVLLFCRVLIDYLLISPKLSTIYWCLTLTSK